MVGTPDPEMVADDIVGINLKGTINMYWCWTESAHTEEHIGKECRIVGVVGIASINTEECCRRIMGIEKERTDGDTIDISHYQC